MQNFGTGVVIEGQRILTNAHLVAYGSEVYVQGRQGGDKVEAEVQALNMDVDLAILTVSDKFFEKRPAFPRSAELSSFSDLSSPNVCRHFRSKAGSRRRCPVPPAARGPACRGRRSGPARGWGAVHVFLGCARSVTPGSKMTGHTEQFFAALSRQKLNAINAVDAWPTGMIDRVFADVEHSLIPEALVASWALAMA